MLLMIFVGSVVAAVVVVAYSYRVLFGSWGQGGARVVYAPPPLPPPPQGVQSMMSVVALPSPILALAQPKNLPMGSGANPVVNAPLPERFVPPLATKQDLAPVQPPRRKPRGSMPPPPPPARVSKPQPRGLAAGVDNVVVGEFDQHDATAVEASPELS